MRDSALLLEENRPISIAKIEVKTKRMITKPVLLWILAEKKLTATKIIRRINAKNLSLKP